MIHFPCCFSSSSYRNQSVFDEKVSIWTVNKYEHWTTATKWWLSLTRRLCVCFYKIDLVMCATIDHGKMSYTFNTLFVCALCSIGRLIGSNVRFLLLLFRRLQLSEFHTTPLYRIKANRWFFSSFRTAIKNQIAQHDSYSALAVQNSMKMVCAHGPLLVNFQILKICLFINVVHNYWIHFFIYRNFNMHSKKH